MRTSIPVPPTSSGMDSAKMPSNVCLPLPVSGVAFPYARATLAMRSAGKGISCTTPVP